MSTKQKTYKGLAIGILCSILYGLYPALINIVPYTASDDSILSVISFIMASVVVIFFFAVLIDFVVIGPKKWFGTIKKFIKSKDAWKITLTNLLGTPIGMGFMAIGIALAGGSLGKAFIALCLPATAILERIFLKRKFRRIALFGIIIVTLSIAAMGVMAVNPASMKTKVLIGLILCLIPVLSWSVQGIIIYRIMEKSKIVITVKEITTLKYLSALIFQVAVVLPLLTLCDLSARNTYVIVGDMFADYKKSLIILAISGALILYSYLCYVQTIKTMGATLGIVFENLSIIYVPIFIAIFYAITKAINPNDSSLSNEAILQDMAHIKTWWFWTFSVTIMIGIVFTVIEPKQGPKGKRKKWFKRRLKRSEYDMYEHI
ncbi:hypothetical protein [Mycoplasma todarodis]|uniref:EamA domain-containing protein n=1 Tax=Mycoplasma todarodis TaxID=1937191 RepID=A0A4R0XQM4_9MOLU|nr:hypothetical protein [Mycoplasma todarodis]TCG10650.1 hypothetical protein C4B25_03380 [Mycoplasma todarodis]